MIDDVQKKIGDAHEKLVSILTDYITGGYLEHLAKLLVYMGNENAEKTISRLPEQMQQEVRKSYESLSSKKNCDPEIISAACAVLNQADFTVKAISETVLKDLPEYKVAEMLKCKNEFFEIDPIIFLYIESSSIIFENAIISLDDRSVQRVLREVDSRELAMVLCNAPKCVSDKIYRNMSMRASEMLKEDIQYMGPVQMPVIHESRQKIVDIIRRLKERGELVLVKEIF